MASPKTITIVALSVALGLFFVFMGTIKLTPRLSRDAYNEMVSTAVAAWREKHGGCLPLNPVAETMFALGYTEDDCSGTLSDGWRGKKLICLSV